ncbi:hypothetical protein BOTBODRAFT_575871 [Botryobasidium botryosum FD-172 SS1]|uniref:Uncharacterized protein n=1 Tax=Botryobasidium botryosum (strain FD-172 SS1) TaxID=930990 RepID=A0A067MP17_BOTB1|nr:hypothetical protein BOTBODRAFT_575871 [Botryobasidium botryosum FD-172 SS1]
MLIGPLVPLLNSTPALGTTTGRRQSHSSTPPSSLALYPEISPYRSPASSLRTSLTFPRLLTLSRRLSPFIYRASRFVDIYFRTPLSPSNSHIYSHN